MSFVDSEPVSLNIATTVTRSVGVSGNKHLNCPLLLN
jgi:hypothetical protein